MKRLHNVESCACNRKQKQKEKNLSLPKTKRFFWCFREHWYSELMIQICIATVIVKLRLMTLRSGCACVALYWSVLCWGIWSCRAFPPAMNFRVVSIISISPPTLYSESQQRLFTVSLLYQTLFSSTFWGKKLVLDVICTIGLKRKLDSLVLFEATGVCKQFAVCSSSLALFKCGMWAEFSTVEYTNLWTD